MTDKQKEHDEAEEQLRIELENEKSRNDALSLEVNDLKDKIASNEAVSRTENEVSIKSELNAFESILSNEGYSENFEISFIIYNRGTTWTYEQTKTIRTN